MDMKVEKIRILADELGLELKIDELIKYRRYSEGEFAFTRKGKKRDKEEYEPKFLELRSEIGKRIFTMLPLFKDKDYTWSYGRLGDGSCYITLWNPEFK